MIKRLAEAIGYPDAVPKGSGPFVFRVDGAEILAEMLGGRLVLSLQLTRENDSLRALAEYAAGRMTREEATLAAEPGKPGAFLWGEVPQGADSHTMANVFEEFMNSCDWWRERAAALNGEAPGDEVTDGAPRLETMLIRP
jgi:hypothetical protein